MAYICNTCAFEDARPSAHFHLTVVPVRHGHWNAGYFHDRVCSCCLHPDNDINDYAHSYCPNCGAKMDETVEDDKR